MSYLIDTFEDKLKFILGAKLFENELLKFELDKLANENQLLKEESAKYTKNDKNT